MNIFVTCNKYIVAKWFVLGFIIGIILVYMLKPKPHIIIEHPTEESIKNSVYRDETDKCYKLVTKDIKCPGNKELFHPILIK